jgi:hypothetical protein
MKDIVFALGVVALAAACGGDAVTASGGGGSAGDAPTGGSNAGGNGAGGAGASGGGGPSGLVCGGFGGAVCPDGELCDYPDDLCGGADGQGTCISIPTTCTEEANPVCGCDGTIHVNPCFAHGAGTDVSNLGGCPLMPGYFACGAKQCSIAAEYCRHVTSDVASQPDEYSCQTIDPPSCLVAVPTCMCVSAETMACGGTCEVSASGGLIVHCPGG